jgi:hypothetical protein
MSGNSILFNKHQLFLSNKYKYHDISENFAGIVIDDISNLKNIKNGNLYLTGDISEIDIDLDIYTDINIFVITELSSNYLSCKFELLCLGSVPINICNVGILYKNIFDSSIDYFSELHKNHTFQDLTESNKPYNSLRNGIYLSNVTESNNKKYFNLLRCSTNLKGPTVNFKPIDKDIIGKADFYCKQIFKDEYQLNHVLAQTYFNVLKGKKTKKGKIKSHSDKTKDMQENGILVFASFYDGYYNNKFNNDNFSNIKQDGFDYVTKKGTSILTTLKFKLKECVDNKQQQFVDEFHVKLYPNSIFTIPIYMNRLYRHETCPANISLEQIPTRIGYVIRCSKTKGLHVDGKTYIMYNNDSDRYIVYDQLVEVDDYGFKKLKNMYYDENMTCDKINYDRFNFSLNDGDYLEPYI